jgi:hypothetical protein
VIGLVRGPHRRVQQPRRGGPRGRRDRRDLARDVVDGHGDSERGNRDAEDLREGLMLTEPADDLHDLLDHGGQRRGELRAERDLKAERRELRLAVAA